MLAHPAIAARKLQFIITDKKCQHRRIFLPVVFKASDFIDKTRN